MKSLISFSFLFLGFVSLCQQTQPLVVRNNIGREINMPWNNEIAGNPLLNKDFKEGTVFFSNGQYIDKIQLHYDIVTDKPIFKDENGKMLYFRDTVKEFIIPYEKKDTTYQALFRFVNYNQNDPLPDSYYEVIFDGKTALYKKHLKVQAERKLDLNKVETYYQDRYTYYVFTKNSFLKITSKKGLIKALNRPDKNIAKYIEDNDINIKKDDDLRKVMKYATAE